MDRNNYARSARANGRGGTDANADAERGREGVWRGEMEKQLAGNTTRNSDTKCSEKNNSEKDSKEEKPNLLFTQDRTKMREKEGK